MLDEYGTVIATTTSDSSGDYAFTDLPAGSYTVRVVQSTIPDGLESSTDYDGGTDGRAVVVLGEGESRSDVDFGHRGTGSIGDTVWNDVDEDGVIDLAEPPISGAEITLTWAGFDGEFGTGDDYTFPIQVTGNDGKYLFEHLPPGDYTVTVDTTSVPGMDPTTPTEKVLLLGPGEDYELGDFGFAVPEPDEELPLTGFGADRLLVLGIGLIALGSLALLAIRRREGRWQMSLERIDRD